MLTKKAKYALRALCALVNAQPEQLQARQVAIAADVPEKFLEAILVELRKAGIIVSKRGVQGGHMLARPAEEIMVGEIIRTIDGPLAPIRCASVTAYRACDDCPEPEACALRLLMGDVRDAMSDVVDQRSLHQLVLDGRRLQRKTKQPVARESRKPAANPG